MNLTNFILTFFLLVFTISIPFYLAGALTSSQLLPGLPVSSLMFVCPGTAALILVYRQNGPAYMISFIKRCIDYKRITKKAWYFPILLLMPFIMTMSYVWMRSMFASSQAATFQVGRTVVIFFVFLIAAMAEELGWSGYITGKMQAKWGALKASILLGMVFAAALFHTMSNITWFLFPVTGFDFNPVIGGLIIAFVACIVSYLWGPGQLGQAPECLGKTNNIDYH